MSQLIYLVSHFIKLAKPLSGVAVSHFRGVAFNAGPSFTAQLKLIFYLPYSKRKLTKKFGSRISDADVLSAALYPKVAEDFFKFREIYGPVDKLSTRHFLVGPKIAEEVSGIHWRFNNWFLL